MSGEANAGCQMRPAALGGFVRSAVVLIISMFVVAAVFAVVAVGFGWTGLAGMQGVALAGAICLVAGLTAEAAGSCRQHLGALAVMLLGMALRLAPPLIVCVLLALMGQKGREHLPFVCYLLGFYFVTLVVETAMAVRRARAES